MRDEKGGHPMMNGHIDNNKSQGVSKHRVEMCRWHTPFSYPSISKNKNLGSTKTLQWCSSTLLVQANDGHLPRLITFQNDRNHQIHHLRIFLSHQSSLQKKCYTRHFLSLESKANLPQCPNLVFCSGCLSLSRFSSQQSQTVKITTSSPSFGWHPGFHGKK